MRILITATTIKSLATLSTTKIKSRFLQLKCISLFLGLEIPNQSKKNHLEFALSGELCSRALCVCVCMCVCVCVCVCAHALFQL